MSKRAASPRFRVVRNGQVIACLRTEADVDLYLRCNPGVTVVDTQAVRS